MNTACLGENLACDEQFTDKIVIRALILPTSPASTGLLMDQTGGGRGQCQGSMDPHGHHMESDSWATPAPLGALGLRARKRWQGTDGGGRKGKKGKNRAAQL